MKRIPPSSKLRQEVKEVFTGWETKGHPRDNFVRLGARYMLQVAVEQEVENYLGRAHYHRGSRRKKGWRNGYVPAKVKTAEGILEIDCATAKGHRGTLSLTIGHDVPARL